MKILFIRRKDYVPLLVIVVSIILIAINILHVEYESAQASGQYREDIPIYSVECEGKKCAVTFDCAWDADDIPRILDILDKYNSKATFFIVGLWAEKYPDMVKRMAERGHEIGNHGYSHAHMSQLPAAKVEEEILRCTEVLEKISGEKVRLFRAPYGEYNASVIKTSHKLNHTSIQWDVDSLDWKKSLSKDDIYNRVIQRVNNGSILLFHNDTIHTVEVLPSVLENLRNNGYECVKVSDLLIKDNYKIRYDGRQIKAF